MVSVTDHGTTPLKFDANSSLAFPDPDGLDVREFPNPVDRKFAAMAGLLHAAKRKSRIGANHAVDEHHACFNLVNELLALLYVVRPCARSKAKAGVIGDPNRIIGVSRPKDASHGAE